MSRIPEEVRSKLTRILTIDLTVYWRWVAAVIKNRLATILAVALVVFWLGVAFYMFMLWVLVFGAPWFDDPGREPFSFCLPLWCY